MKQNKSTLFLGPIDAFMASNYLTITQTNLQGGVLLKERLKA